MHMMWLSTATCDMWSTHISTATTVYQVALLFSLNVARPHVSSELTCIYWGVLLLAKALILFLICLLLQEVWVLEAGDPGGGHGAEGKV